MGILRDNSAAAALAALGVLEEHDLELAASQTRDRDDVAVYRCRRTGIYALATSHHVDAAFYRDKRHAELESLGSRERVVAVHEEDTRRRAEFLRPHVINARWVDVGTGSGAVLEAVGSAAATVLAIEPQEGFRKSLSREGYTVFEAASGLEPRSCDVATLFHVLEHFAHPLEELRQVARALRPGGLIVVEIPHARDALLSMYASAAFARHTFWSEHLVLHTRQTLSALLEASGFGEIIVRGVQRYPLANHLYWLARQAPGGHHAWSQLLDGPTDDAYARLLASVDATDTLIATARRVG